MADEVKRILVVAQSSKTEALRMAAGLTLLDDPVQVAVIGELEVSPDVEMQLESLDFAEVPVTYCETGNDAAPLATAIGQADVVFVV